MGIVLIAIGMTLGVVVYFATAFVFFGRGDNFLGVAQLAIPPTELVLPWVASTRLGVLSVVSFILTIVGVAIQKRRGSGD
jgi:hypothetical protein